VHLFFKSVSNSQSSVQLCHQELVEQLQYFKTFYVSYASATKFLRKKWWNILHLLCR